MTTKVKQFSFVFLLLQVSLITAELPNIKKCKVSDSACLSAFVQMLFPFLAPGVPELGTEPLDVMTVPYNKADLSGLKLGMYDLRVKGMKDAVVGTTKLDMEKKVFEFTNIANISFKCKYKASGQLLILPISGDGIFTAKLKQIEVTMTMPFEIKKNKDGKDVIELSSYKLKSEVKENASFKLTNLFNGNKSASEVLHKFMNDSWKLVSNEFGGTLLVEPYRVIFNSIRAYLLAQPLENLIISN